MGYNNKFYKIYKKQIGLWMHSIFSNTKIKKYKVLRIIELWLIKAASGVIAYILRINKNTIYRILKKLSKILVDKFYSYKNYIGSSDEIIEIDESKI